MKLNAGLFRHLARISSASLLCLTVGGCAGDEGISESEFISRTVEEVCAQIFSCGCEDVDPEYTQALCVETRTQGQEWGARVAEIDGLTFDGVCGEQQVNELMDDACRLPEVGQQDDDTCERPCKLYYGPMKAGASCQVGTSGLDNCKQGLSCVGGLCEDPCDEVVPANLGELCYALTCVEGAWCDDSVPYAPVCVVRPGFNQPCADTNPDPDVTNYLCGEGLYCDAATDPLNPICLAYPDVGQECPAGDCAVGAYCDFTQTPEICVDIPGVAEECTFVCEPGSFCDSDFCPPGVDCITDPSLVVPTCVENDAYICSLAPAAPPTP